MPIPKRYKNYVQIISTSTELATVLDTIRKESPKTIIGFVPTMGALHEGHMDLIKAAKERSDKVICSIFVNPTQFNDPKDLERYPRKPKEDIDLLGKNECDYLFLPDVETIYPNGISQKYEIDFDGIDQVMEGQFRPGHFKGVAMVVERFFNLVKPDLAFFGRKDFQQVAIIKRLVKVRSLPVKIQVVETTRSQSGLALSSRNALLSEAEKEDALIIYKTLRKSIEWAKSIPNALDLKQKLIDYFNTGNLKLEYLELVDDESLLPVGEFRAGCTCCIAAYCGNVRLIDNMAFQ